MKDDQKKLYRRVTVTLLTQLDDGTVVWPGEEVYVEASHKEMAYAHPRCETCVHYAIEKCMRPGGLVKAHPKDYCSNYQTKEMPHANEIN